MFFFCDVFATRTRVCVLYAIEAVSLCVFAPRRHRRACSVRLCSLDAIDAMPKYEGPSQYNKDAASHGAENSGSFCTVKPQSVRFWRSYASANFE